MPTFLYPWLAVAGAAAAAVPLIVHLLNRRKFHVVEWAAMDFLREALTRSRRMMELRDLLLLLLRVLCLLIFGMALARPYWNSFSEAAVDPNQPVHAVVLVDNSLSMAYEKPGGILLDSAKEKAKQFIEGLPAGSLISVVPTCGSEAGVFEAHARREDALDALNEIRPVDGMARADQVIERAAKTCRDTTSMAARRIFLVTDQQVANWSAEAQLENLKQLPCPMQIAEVTADKIENVWVKDVQLRDGMANTECPAVFVATIGYEGAEPRKGVPVVLHVDGQQVGSVLVDLQPGQSAEVVFPEYRFQKFQTRGQTRYAAVEVAVQPDKSYDRLPEDNFRAIVVPVADSLPVVFVDALGGHEDAKNKLFGDTWGLRRWLAPQSGQPGEDRPLVQIRHVTIDELNRQLLADARLVVIAGVARPSPDEVALLRQYVEQGGNLLLAAGGAFDPAAWTDAAWQNGLGIMPAPLAAATEGYARDDRRWATAKMPPLTLNFESAQSSLFRPEGVSDDDLSEAFGSPVFFHKIVVAQPEKVAEPSAAAIQDYFTAQRKSLADIDNQLAAETGAPAGGSQQKIADLQLKREKIHPDWLRWKKAAGQEEGEQLPVSDLVQRAQPQVLARYSNDRPMLLRRRWGQGQVLFLTTSLSRDWTTLHDLQQSAWLVDRIARCLLAETLTAWNVDSERGLNFPVAVGEHAARFTLVDPQGNRQELQVDHLGGDRYGIGLNNFKQRGIYHVKSQREDGSALDNGAPGSDIPLAVDGPAEESQLIPAQKPQTGGKSFVEVSALAYSASPMQFQGIDLWKWFMGVVLALLLAELLLAARSTPRGEAAA